MKIRIMSMVAVLAMVSFAATASAGGSGDCHCTQQKASTVTKADTGDCCGSCQKSCNSGCSGKKAVTVADKANDCWGSGEGTCGQSCDKPCDKPCGKTVAHQGSGCPVAAKVETIMASLPSMKYQVGDKTTCCEKSAEMWAKKTNEPIKFVVGDQVVDRRSEAKAILTGMLQKELQSFESMQYAVGGESVHCPKTARKVADKHETAVAYRVAGFDFDCHEKAEKVARLVKDAATNVHMGYKVGDETYHCSRTAGAKHKANGGSMTYVVGDNETPCDATANLMLVQAKIRAAVETAAEAYGS